MIPFDLIRAPLTGVHLIEASAGTGKTYAICGLYGRLVVESGLGVDQILVLTFTEAATEELKGRIRDRLRTMDRALAGQGPTDSWIADWARNLADADQARRRLADALGRFDQTAIYTIHGFCQRLLADFAFELGVRFDAEMVGDASTLVTGIAVDFWDRTVARMTPAAAGAIMALLPGPAFLTALWAKASADDAMVVVPDTGPVDSDALNRFVTACRELGTAWGHARQDAINAVTHGALNASVFGSATTSAAPGRGRTDRVARMVDAMDRMASRRHPLPQQLLEKPLINWSAETLAAYSLKNKLPPKHEFFDQVARVVAIAREAVIAVEQMRVNLIHEFFAHARTELDRRKADGNVRTYDDLLRMVRDGLLSTGGAVLRTAVRNRYQAALVDEFQDTDPCQYQIVQRLFHGHGGALFMIGDPKQAIYGFRGADLFSYLAAAQATDESATLVHNWRSTPTMIQAVNTLFASHPDPFALDRITFSPVRPACPETTLSGSGCSPGPMAPALVLWDLNTDDESLRRLTMPALKDRIADAVAATIASWSVEDEGAQLSTAVLVRTNADAHRVYDRLLRAGIGCALHGAGSVLATQEALAMYRLLQAVRHPGRIRWVAAAWVTDLIDADPRDWADTGADDPARQSDLLRFYEYNTLWEAGGVLAMLRQVMIRERVAERFIQWRDGQRRITNLVHLQELIGAAAQTRSSPSSLVHWLGAAIREARTAGGRPDPEYRLRLDVDDAAVQVLTIHQSKGLEFDRVFLPFAWHRSNASDPVLVFHDPTRAFQPTLDVAADPPEPHRQWAAAEALSEELRLLYVALTRSRSRCYVAWQAPGRGAISALAYLLQNENRGKPSPAAWASRSGGAVSLRPMPEPSADAGAGKTETTTVLESRLFRGRIDNRWRVSSFSSLTAATHAASPDTRDWDSQISIFRDDPAVDTDASLTAFPAGTRTGICFHEILESVDWSDPITSDQRQRIEQGLGRFGFGSRWVPAVEGLFERLREAPLPGPVDPVVLGTVPPSSRVAEMEFHLPLTRFDSPRIAEQVTAVGRGKAARALAERLGRGPTPVVVGYLKGYIDLWFRADGRYFLLDWKTNDLGRRPDDYTPDRLLTVMADHNYLLQYTLYTLALNRHLEQRLPGYTYASDFGGVFYLFVRGLGLGDRDDTGVFFDRPEPALIQGLDRMILGAPGASRP